MPKKTSKRTPRVTRHDYWRRPVADPTEALEQLHEARGRLTLAGIGGDASDPDRAAMLKRLAEDVNAAQAKVDACFEKVRLNALRGDRFEALLAEHPPTPEDEEKDLSHHDATFLPALLAECCDNGWGLEEWVEELAEMTAGERRELRETVTHLNTRSWAAQIPKG